MPKVPVFTTAEAAEEAFYDAMRRGDATALLSLWADDDDVVCVHPGSGRLVGLAAIRASWQEILANGGVDVRPVEVRVIQSATVAVHSLIERITVGGRMGSEVVECVVTNVWVKHPLGWRIVVHQAGPGGDAVPQSAAAAGGVLH